MNLLKLKIKTINLLIEKEDDFTTTKTLENIRTDYVCEYIKQNKEFKEYIRTLITANEPVITTVAEIIESIISALVDEISEAEE